MLNRSRRLINHARVLVVALLLTVLAAALSAHTDTGTIAGRIADASGAVVPGATITAKHLGTGATTVVRSGPEGLYVVPALAPGRYRLDVTLAGFKTAVRPSVVLNVGTTVTEDFRLEVGDISMTITLDDGRAALVDTTSSSVSTLIDRQFIENLPLNGRSFQTLLELTPGVVMSEATINNGGQFTVNGQRANANYFLVDGVSANASTSVSATSFQQAGGTLPNLTVFGGTNSLASVDAVEEVRVLTSTYAAEYGRSPGGQVSLVTRSGTNRFTGSAYEYFRDESLDANDWFRDQQSLGKLPLRQNQFGGVAGGPVAIPGLYDGRSRTFFFFSYEGSRLVQPQPQTQFALVPSVEARSQAQGALRALFNAYPLPNTTSETGDPALTGRYLISASFPSRFDATSVKIDQQFASARLFSRFNVAPSSVEQRAFANGKNRFTLDNTTWTTGLTWSLSPNVVADTRLNYTDSGGRFEFGMFAIDGAIQPDDDVIFPAGASRDTTSVSWQLTPFGGASQTAANLTFGKSLANQQRQWNIVLTISALRGRHELKAGIDYRRLSPIADFRERGISYNFGGSVAQALSTNGTATVSVQALAPTADFVFHNASLFAQDTWRLSSRLTVTSGLRYEINPAPGGERLPYLVQGMDDPLTATLAPENTRAWRTTYDNIAPRLGASYLLTSDGATVLRGGFGLFYDVGTGTALRGYSGYPYNSNRSSANQPFPAPPAALAAAPFVTAAPYSAQFFAFDPDLQLPRTRQWNVSIERALGSAQSVTVSYVGAAGRGLLRNEVYGNRTPGGVPVILLNPALFTNTATVFYTHNGGSSSYDSLQVQYQRRLLRGLQALGSYTLASSTDNASDEATANILTGGVNQFVVDPSREFGPSDFDIRHSAIASLTYDLPGPSGAGVMHALFANWGLDGIVRARSGSPITVVTQVVDPLNISTPRRVDVVPGEPAWIDDDAIAGGRKLNPAAFAVPATGTQGNFPRNSLRSLAAWQADISIRRRFLVGGGARLEVRVDAFNFLNHTNFGEPNATLGTTGFGTSTVMLNRALGQGGSSGGFNPLYQIGGPRAIQLSARVVF